MSPDAKGFRVQGLSSRLSAGKHRGGMSGMGSSQGIQLRDLDLKPLPLVWYAWAAWSHFTMCMHVKLPKQGINPKP